MPYVNTLQGSHNTPEFSHGRCSPLVGYPHAASLWYPRGVGISGGGISFTPKLGSPDGSSAESSPSKAIGRPHFYRASFDGGAVSSWYVFSALGFYPMTPGVPQDALGSPLFDKATITSEDGKKFTIVAENNSADNVSIKDASLNGKSWSKNWINHSDIMKGGTLHFSMSAGPNQSRGTLEEDKPFSVSRVE